VPGRRRARGEHGGERDEAKHAPAYPTDVVAKKLWRPNATPKGADVASGPMNKLSIVALVFAAACSKGGMDAALDKMDSFKDQVCACKDEACVDGVKKDMDKWMEANKDLKKKEPSEAQKKRGDEIFKALDACKEKIEGAAGAAQVGESLTKMKGFADAMCACKDAACASKVGEEMSAFGKTVAGMKGTPTEEQMKEMTDVSTRLSDCMAKAMTPADSAGSAAGSAEGSAAGSGT
jgi:hypothetical protein